MPQGVFQSKFVVALDGMDMSTSLKLAKELSGHVWGFKVNDLLVEMGTTVVSELKQYGKVFADPKLYDIPNTVANAVDRLVIAGADLITVHASGGPEMLAKAVKAGGDRILAVTVLTSMSAADIEDVYGVRDMAFHDDDLRRNTVANLATLAQKAKCWGIVCAAGDVPYVPAGVRTVIPGFRPQGLIEGDDQKSVADFKNIKAADLIVVGRPVTMSHDPLGAVKFYNEQMEEP